MPIVIEVPPPPSSEGIPYGGPVYTDLPGAEDDVEQPEGVIGVGDEPPPPTEEPS